MSKQAELMENQQMTIEVKSQMQCHFKIIMFIHFQRLENQLTDIIDLQQREVSGYHITGN